MNNYLFIFIVLLMIQPISAQWEAGASFNYKSEIPRTGFGLYAGRNLPFQWATIGLKVRSGIDLFIGNNNNSKTYSNESFHVDLIATLFYRYTSPYFGLSMGITHYSVNDFNKFIFLIGIPAGIKFPITDLVQPFIEININKLFSSFDIDLASENISSFQFTGKAGLIIRF